MKKLKTPTDVVVVVPKGKSRRKKIKKTDTREVPASFDFEIATTSVPVIVSMMNHRDSKANVHD